MRTRVRKSLRTDVSAEPTQTPARDLPALREVPTWRRAAPLTAEDTALPGRMLMLLSRLHRSELQLRADSEAAGAGPQGA